MTPHPDPIPDRLTCLRCGHTWRPIMPHPVKCPSPRCLSPYWDRPRRNRRIKETLDANLGGAP